VDGEAVLILADASEINVLNRVGSLIFELSDGAHSVNEIVDEITRQFDISREQAESDTLAFLAELEKQRVLLLEQR
jgi:hypothetical protein